MNPALKAPAHAWADDLCERRPLRDLYQPLWKMPEDHARALVRRAAWVAATALYDCLSTTLGPVTLEPVPPDGQDVLLHVGPDRLSLWLLLEAAVIKPGDTLSDPAREALRACPPSGSRPSAWDARVVRQRMYLAFAASAVPALAGVRRDP